ncbi:16409_t:CDS:2 [Entrophospora sp. SA101]|nr:16409_t:CDS:2 [Entrophospora sp. SA101]
MKSTTVIAQTLINTISSSTNNATEKPENATNYCSSLPEILSLHDI